jgi:predicted DNA-binding protein (MmcQ/YjbR family)
MTASPAPGERTVTFGTIRDYCLKKPGVTEEFPFGRETLVFKVGGRMFCLMGAHDRPVGMNLKCDPFVAGELREKYASVRPGYHMNKRHWNTVVVDGSIPDAELLWMIDHSYGLVFDGLRAGVKEKIRGK